MRFHLAPLLFASLAIAHPMQLHPRQSTTFCLRHIKACLSGYTHSSTASYAAQELFPEETLHNGTGDAFRHCYWSALMTIDVGVAEAKAVGDAHEADGGNPANEVAMDLANNETGRGVGAATTGDEQTRYDAANVECYSRAKSGKLVTLI